MRISKNGFLFAGWATVAVGVALGEPPPGTAGLYASSSVRPIIAAIDRGDCDSAVKAANDGIVADDGDVVFLVGRMLNTGICTHRNPGGSAAYFQHALLLGANGSAMDWAVRVGVGEGVQQSYERAGEICRTGGVDPQARMSRYSLGYACTLGGLTAELVRASLPRNALEPGPALIDFTPKSGAMEIRQTPRVAVTEAAQTGTRLHRSVDPAQEITRAWNKAMARAPKPDPTILDTLTVELPIDLDARLESAGKRASMENSGVLQLGEKFPGAMRMPSTMAAPGSH